MCLPRRVYYDSLFLNVQIPVISITGWNITSYLFFGRSRRDSTDLSPESLGNILIRTKGYSGFRCSFLPGCTRKPCGIFRGKPLSKSYGLLVTSKLPQLPISTRPKQERGLRLHESYGDQNMGTHLLTRNQLSIVALEKHLSIVPDQFKAFAASLMRSFNVKGSLTPAQWHWVREINSQTKKQTKAKKIKPYFIYAIKCGDAVKIGFSSNPRQRANALQIGNPEMVSLAWKVQVSCSPAEAKSAEHKLHKVCKNHHIRGEWYSSECMGLIQEFKFKAGEKRKRDKILGIEA